ncbi:ubiquinone biosynthesis regulatory protein kinase UbiB [Aliidiomarina minuta]|uniref:Probable protein kinase UbiB n=1 Tax=Aliidiomarina minuta TaxID=880057 RepID=A0A432W3R3_9GAMM|nr:ubiquinone biosynthesis regulatory protein kinase UbiB [Aliidiomarina minuta]RUO24005.1 ubiquinone biosynthesis regulatory protein kinase UbiB [Aliidiomarina minuta]
MRSLRFYRILRTLLQHGVDEMIPKRWLPWYVRIARRCLFWLRNKHKDKPLGVRFRLALEDLGPVFVKLGQMLSTRRDLLHPDIIVQLAMLQDKVPPFPGDQAQRIIEKALNDKPVEDIFVEFQQVPLASASIAQVHTASLLLPDDSIKEVVVKVIRPDITATIHADLDLMESVAMLAARYLPDGKRLKPVEVIREYRKTLLDELNLAREAANAIQLRRNFSDSEVLYIPEVYSDYTRNNVMVMERIAGIPIGDVETLADAGVNLKLLAERGVEVFFTQVFRDSFFHADMHPGNIFVDASRPEDPRYLAIDFGIVGTLNRDDKRYLAENFIAFFNRDYRKVAELHVDSGWVPSHINIEDFESAIRTVCEPIFEKPLKEISFGHVLINLFNTARRFEMEVQPQLVLLQKTLLYVEGLGRNLYPDLDLWKTAKPYLERWMHEQVGWRAVLRSVKEHAPYWAEKLPQMPSLVYDTLQQSKMQMKIQQNYMEELLMQQQQAAESRIWAFVASTLSVSTLVLVLVAEEPWWAAGAGAVALFSWFKAWRDRPRHFIK